MGAGGCAIESEMLRMMAFVTSCLSAEFLSDAYAEPTEPGAGMDPWGVLVQDYLLDAARRRIVARTDGRGDLTCSFGGTLNHGDSDE